MRPKKKCTATRKRTDKEIRAYKILGLGAALHSNTPLQSCTSPSSAAKCLTFADGKAFVNVSAIMSVVGQ